MDGKVTVPALRARKGREKISALTAYDYPTGCLVDRAGIDLVLVGDSLGNTVLGYESTIPVTLEEMLAAVRAVRRGVRRALLVGDMPFGSYHGDPARAVEAAVAFVKAGAEAVKIEGGRRRAELAKRFVENEIPVLGHIGLTPQSIHAMGGYKVQGKTPDEAAELLDDARALEEAGAFALVLEGIPSEVSSRITREVIIPTIGIGAGPGCDGQILVLTDLLGLTLPVPPPALESAGDPASPPAEPMPRKPRFVRQYLDLKSLIASAVGRYIEDVRSGGFPSEKESYRVSSAVKLPPR